MIGISCLILAIILLYRQQQPYFVQLFNIILMLSVHRRFIAVYYFYVLAIDRTKFLFILLQQMFIEVSYSDPEVTACDK